jgi:hypothetical protein
MERDAFDRLATTLAQTQSRRSSFRLFGAALLGAGGLAVGLHAEAAGRKQHHHQQGHGGSTGGGGDAICLHAGAFCETDKQCCPDKTKRICDVPENASNSDTKCCGGAGAVCGGVNDDGDQQAPFCCVGQAGVRSFVCSENDPNNPGVQGTCHPAPSED